MFENLQTRFVSAVDAASGLARKAGEVVARPVVVGSGALLAAGAARAESTIDTTAIVATIGGGVTAISAIGVAVISLVVTIKLYK